MLITHKQKLDVEMTIEEACELIANLSKAVAHASQQSRGPAGYGYFTQPANHTETGNEQPKFQLKDVSDKPEAVICDLDGTLSHMVSRGPFDWANVESDKPDDMIFGALVAQTQMDRKIIVMSGRDSVCREQTTNWLNYWFVEYFHQVTGCPRSEINQAYFGKSNLHMRAEGDQRNDVIVKNELFFEHVDGKYKIAAVFDDRPKVCRGWYDLGLKVIHCANPYVEF